MIKQRKNSLLNKFALALPGAGIGLFAFASLAGAVAWFEPTNYPPTGNVAAPLNIGALAQGKLGGLSLGKAAPTAGQLLDVAGSGAITTLSTGFLAANGLVATNSFAFNGGSPSAGKYLKSTGADGNAIWDTPTLSTVSPSQTDITNSVATYPGALKIVPKSFSGYDGNGLMYNFLRKQSEFRNWVATSNGNANILTPQTAAYSNNFSFLINNTTAAKLCEFFTDNQLLITYEDSEFGSTNNDVFTFWDPSQNKWRINWSSLGNNRDYKSITCLAPKGIVRGNSYVRTLDYPIIRYTGSGSGVCDNSYTCAGIAL